ncbi:NAD binding domain of 6-phosphogluconate dehydrogenase-domain-containing protein [Phellopilus nigrolimitatus]|nr:NAD binding domain of 6-phosphogluconate dehydrogenase-domain-containing protein [Phellopilus nigrolimitatus]
MSAETTSSSQPEWPGTVGFIGLGNMGWWMALNLRKALPKSSILYIRDINTAIVDDFVAHSQSFSLGDVVACHDARSVADSAVSTDVVFSIVPEGSHVRAVFLDSESGLLTGKVDDKTFVDCSTIDTATSLAVAQAVTKTSTSAHFYDAPVSGGTAGAEAATLTFMVGASEGDTHFQKLLEPLLKLMGKNVFCLGAPSLGLAAKLCNNYLSGLCNIATSEAMNIGMRHGIDPKVLSEVFKKSSGGNWNNSVCPNAVTSRGYKGGFKIQLMKKDFTLAVESAKEVDAKLVLGEAGLATYTAAAEDPRCRDLDARVVYRWIGGKE